MMSIRSDVARVGFFGLRPLLLVLLSFACSSAFAVSLGNIEVSSRLNERLTAKIVLRGLKANELDNLRVALADEETFRRLGLERGYGLTELKFSLVSTGARRGYIKITSAQRIREPSMSFVVEARNTAKVVNRRYDLLFDLR